MTKRRTPDHIAAAALQEFYRTPGGKAAIALLFRDFGFYDTPAGDQTSLIRSIGQRDVLVRISQLIGFKPEQAPSDDEDHSDYIAKMMRQ